MYSEHGFDALMRPVFGSVCHELIVVSYWTPGSAQRHAASAMSCRSFRALIVSTTEPSVRAVRFQSESVSTASMNASETRTELFAFWYWIDAQSGESIESSIERMKHAEHCGFSSNPTLNHTGELNAASWLTRIAFSSSSKVCASSSDAKYPSLRPHVPTVVTMRPIICLTERSRSGL